MGQRLQHDFAPVPLVGGVPNPRLLYRQLFRRGELVFDIGAHVGERTFAMLEMGAKVVAVEPQEEVARSIDPRAYVEVALCWSEPGEVGFRRCPGNSYMSSAAPDYESKVQQHGSYSFAEAEQVRAVTLDQLIDVYGLPAFVKIDTEGTEDIVLQGLSQAPGAVSFEVHDFDPDKGDRCIARLEELGRWWWFYSPRESFLMEQWPPADLAIFGDIYGVLRP